jgi:hypothetical protein
MVAFCGSCNPGAIVEDGAYGMAVPPQDVGATQPVAFCIKQSFVMGFDAHPAEPVIARCRIVATRDPEAFQAYEVEAPLVEVFAESRDQAPSSGPEDPSGP